MTNKQKIFCEQYVIDWDGTKAAIRAGYSKKTARSIACENLTKPYIKEYISEIQKDIAKLAGVSALRNILELKKTAYSNIACLHNTWIDLKDFESLTEDQKACIESIDTRIEKKTLKQDGEEIPIEIEVKQVKIKLYSKLQAIDQINKMMGYNEPSKIDHTSSDGSQSNKVIILPSNDRD